MSHHTSNTLAGVMAAGGIYGYYSKGSKPSLIAGLTLGAAYGLSSYLILSDYHFQGHALAAASSALCLGAGLHRYPKATSKALPLGLIGIGGAALYYQGMKAWEWKDNM